MILDGDRERTGESPERRGGCARCAELESALEQSRISIDSLQESASAWQAIFDAWGDAVWLLSTDNRVIRTNAAAVRVLGVEPPVHPEAHCWALFHGGSERAPACPVPRMLATLKRETAELCEGDRWFRVTVDPILDEHGVHRATVHIVQDVTEQRQTEAALRETEALYRTLARNLPGIAYRFQLGPPRRTRFFNDMLATITGYDETELRPGEACPIDSLIHPSDRQGVIDAVRKAVDDGSEFEVEYRLVSRSGAPRICWERGRPSRSPEGDGVWIDGVIFDVTTRKREEDERREADAWLRQTQKLESLGVLAGGIAHDFNNLLTAILGNIELALTRMGTEPHARSLLAEAEKATRRAAELTGHMLAYSGRGSFVMEPVKLDRIIVDMRPLLRASTEPAIDLQFELADSLPRLEGDPAQIRQVLASLVVNASEAIGKAGGTIKVAARSGVFERHQFTLADGTKQLLTGRFIILEVADTGCGMDTGTLAKVFDPFFTTKFTGRGLGLAAVQGIVRGHHGVIEVETDAGRGSTFRVYLPACADESEERPRQSIMPAEWSGSGKVLLVDDEEAIRLIGAQILTHLGFTVVLARDGQEAVELYGRHASELTCVVLDLTMPRLDGDQALREMRKVRKDVPVVITSGYGETEVTQRLAGAGLAGFLQKPFRLSEMARLLRRVTAGKQAPQ